MSSRDRGGHRVHMGATRLHQDKNREVSENEATPLLCLPSEAGSRGSGDSPLAARPSALSF